MAMEDRETFSLIGSDKVEGTNVYGADGGKVGYIERVMIDKVSGKVSYAVLSFRGAARHWRRSLSVAMAGAEIRPTSGATSPASPRTSSAAPRKTPTRAAGIGVTPRPRAP